MPKFFCVPVDKEHNGEFLEHKGEEHLTVYDVTPESKPNERIATDQFGRHEAQIQRSVFLAVPSEKLAFRVDE